VSKDLKRMLAEIRGALDGYPREQLQEILAYVFKEYVVEGSSAPAQGAMAMLDARTELEGLSFAELVTWLQLHLDVPELAQLDVHEGRVFVRVGGRAVPIESATAPALPTADSRQPTAQPAPAQPPSPVQPANPTPATTAQPGAPATTTAPPAKPAEGEQKTEEGAQASRFSWLEVD
jgi:hypothetical protein